jgi:hypothetical protein
VGTSLNAQLLGGKEKFITQGTGWEISASFAPDFSKRPRLNGVQFEIDPNDIPVGQLPIGDTINIAGEDRIFDRVRNYGLRSTPAESNFWFGASITAHRRIGRGLDLSAGVFYNQAGHTTSIKDEVVQQGVVNTLIPVIYSSESIDQKAYGLTLRTNYHLFSKARIHPYFGVGINLFRRLYDRQYLGRIYTGEPTTLLPPRIDVGPSSIAEIQLDFVATAGLLFRVSDTWSVGLDITSRPVVGPGLVGLQVRRML